MAIPIELPILLVSAATQAVAGASALRELYDLARALQLDEDERACVLDAIGVILDVYVGASGGAGVDEPARVRSSEDARAQRMSVDMTLQGLPVRLTVEVGPPPRELFAAMAEDDEDDGFLPVEV